MQSKETTSSMSDPEDNAVVLHNQPISKPVQRLLTPLLPKKVPPVPDQSERKPLPIYNKNPFSFMFLTWLTPMLSVGYKRTLQQNDLWTLGEGLTVEDMHTKFNQNLKKLLNGEEITSIEDNDKLTWIMIKAFVKTFPYSTFFAAFLRLISNIAAAFTPLVTKKLIQFIERRQIDPTERTRDGIGYAFALSIMLAIHSILINQSFLLAKSLGANSSVILTKQLLEKTMVANGETRYKTPNGKVVSLLNADLSRIDLAMGFVPVVFSFPAPIIIGITLLIINLGVSALAGVGAFFILTAITVIPMREFLKSRIAANKFTDERVSTMRELLLSMKMVKFYSWEDAYENIIKRLRSEEIGFVMRIQIATAFVFTLALGTPILISMTSFLVLSSISNRGNAANIFASLTLFNILSEQALDLPSCLIFLADSMTALKRISNYLRSPEDEYQDQDFYDDHSIDEKFAIKVTNADFSWDVYKEEGSDDESQETSEKALTKKKKTEKKDKNDKPLIHESLTVLKNVNLDVRRGEFIVITGTIGSGKSSLLSAMFGLMHKSVGKVGVNGSIIFTGHPWVQNATFRENIVFGAEYDEQWYHEVIENCALYDDLKLLKAGDLTEIGERGVTLSGGQKARLNLARAVYANKDIYLLDDILSAVDANVGNHITEQCLFGLLKDKTRVLATHQLSLIKRADRVVFLKNDGSVDLGTESELKSRNKAFVELMEFNKHLEETENDGEDDEEKVGDYDENRAKAVINGEDGDLFDDEERAVNAIPLSLYGKYSKAGQGVLGWVALPLLALLMILSVFTNLFTNVWLSFWIEQKFTLSRGQYIGIYVMMAFVSMVITFLELSVFGYMIVTSSKNLNLDAVKRILHTPMSYLDTTPVGRILNRFSKDTNTLDNEIHTHIKLFTHLATESMGTLILAIIYIPWFAIAFPIIGTVLICVANYYQASAREVKRLEAINRSFILNNFNEVLGGISTIKAFGATTRFSLRNNKFCNMMNEVYLVVIANQRWINLTLDMIASLIVLLVSLLTVTGQFNLNPASSGLLVSYMIQFALVLSTVLVFYAETENDMNSVERVIHYANDLEQEASYRIPETAPPENWPINGDIKFTDVSLRYREGLPLIFKNLTFDVQGGEKIGICGRTGAGKSSLMTALYRIVELYNGKIEIDGIDIAKLGLFELRSKLSIIPQDPVLFKGSIRKNLDPFGESTDERLWDALRRAGVFNGEDFEAIKKQVIDPNSVSGADDSESNKFHLEAPVQDDGSNFSLGEKQLIALARALVRDSKILIMDEATSSVDYETDALVQATIAKEFSHCTVLCIAHRLKTILHHDRILVLEKGELAEYDTPVALFQAGGIFTQMCEASKITKDDF